MTDGEGRRDPGDARTRHERLSTSVAELVARGSVSPIDAVTRVAVAVLGLSGAVVRLVTAGGTSAELQDVVAAAAPAGAARIDEIEFDLGEGPGRDCHLTMRPVLVPDLDDAVRRWPAYAPAALAAGTCSVFAYPMHVGAARLGVLSMHGSRPRHLDADEVATSLTLARIATATLLDGMEVDDRRGVGSSFFEHLGARDRVYQAQGMTAARLDLSLTDALTFLRAQAYASGQELGALCAEVVAGTLQLGQLRDPPP